MRYEDINIGDKVIANGWRNDGADHEYATNSTIERWVTEATTLVVKDLYSPDAGFEVSDGRRTYVLHHSELSPAIEDGQVTLAPGDYVSTAGMTEDQYHAVARAFMAAGAESGEYPEPDCIADDMGETWAFGSRHGTLWHGRAACFKGRHLTISQVLSATNAGNKEEDMTPCEKLGYKVGDRFVANGATQFSDGSIVELYRDDGSSCPLWKLISGHCKYRNADKKPGAYDYVKYFEKIGESCTLTQTLRAASEHEAQADQHRAKYDELMQQAREMLPDGWRLLRDDEPNADMGDPKNWKQGDQLECVKSWKFGTKGKIYKVGNFNRAGYRPRDEGVLSIPVSDDDGDNASVAHHYFRFHSRPTT